MSRYRLERCPGGVRVLNAGEVVIGLLYDTDEAQKVADLMTERDRLLAALKAVLEVANVRIDDPRCGVFDTAREAVKAAEGNSENF